MNRQVSEDSEMLDRGSLDGDWAERMGMDGGEKMKSRKSSGKPPRLDSNGSNSGYAHVHGPKGPRRKGATSIQGLLKANKLLRGLGLLANIIMAALLINVMRSSLPRNEGCECRSGLQCEQGSGSWYDAVLDFWQHHPPAELFVPIPLHKQSTDYTCGPSSALSVALAYNLIDPSLNMTLVERDLCLQMQCNDVNGTDWPNIAGVMMQRFGFYSRAERNMSIADLKAQLLKGRLTIIDYQAWKDDSVSYSTDWADGHYSVFIGWNSTGIFLMDPWQAEGFYGYVENERLPKMWHDGTPDYFGFGLSLWQSDTLLPGISSNIAPNILRTG